MMRSLRCWSSLAALGLALALTGCDTLFGDDDETPEILPALEIRAVFPEDGVILNPLPGETFDLSVDFSRPVSMSELGLRLVPEPLSTGPLAPTGTGRNVAWLDVEFSTEVPVYRWLIDGTTLEVPGLVRIFPTSEVPLASFSGSISSADTNRVKGLGTVIFALDEFAAFNPFEPGSFLEVEPQALTVAVVADNVGVEWPYVMTNLNHRDLHLVVAIVDSNHDTVYDPTEDWWGYHRDDSSDSPGVVMASSVVDSVITTVDIRLGPPRASRIAP